MNDDIAELVERLDAALARPGGMLMTPRWTPFQMQRWIELTSPANVLLLLDELRRQQLRYDLLEAHHLDKDHIQQYASLTAERDVEKARAEAAERELGIHKLNKLGQCPMCYSAGYEAAEQRAAKLEAALVVVSRVLSLPRYTAEFENVYDEARDAMHAALAPQEPYQANDSTNRQPTEAE